MFNYYEQDGDHSAVTGGEGTQELQNYAPTIILNLPLDSLGDLNLDVGVDYYSSASTDRIDARLSNASSHDIRYHVNAAYTRELPKKKARIQGRTSFSVESDYMSTGFGLGLEKDSKDENRTVSIQLQTYFDNVEWGWLDDDRFFTPQELVYPKELRDSSWFDITHRHSYSLGTSVSQNLNKRWNASVFGELIYQQGLLSTPFHRVFFPEEIRARVENLPRERWKVPVGFRSNYFLSDRFLFRSYYRFYWDDFGIVSSTASLEVPVKISPFFSVYPFYRYYTQTASDYFAPFEGHDPLAAFYTSDYDLSAFDSHKFGVGLRFDPVYGLFRFHHRVSNQRWKVGDWNLRFARYDRSDGLEAWTISLAWTVDRG